MNKNTFISASAGTGKTYRLVEEYMEILRSDEKLGIENILAITFTEKAAAEMKERVAKAILEQIDKAASESERKRWKEINSRVMHAWISTIHSFCARILRESILNTNSDLDPGFSIITGTKKILELQALGRFFSRNLDSLDEMIDIYGLDNTHKILEDCLSKKRHNMYLYSPIENKDKEENAEKISRATAVCHEAFKKLNKEYEELTLKKAQLDFEQLLEETRKMLNDNPKIAAEYSKRFKYILVDEFQDTDELQAEIISKLTASGNVKVLFVGDDKQSIYRFRGANVEIFNLTRRKFEESDDATDTLGKSYRSHPEIVKFHNIFFKKVMSNPTLEAFASRYGENVEALEPHGDRREKRVRILESKGKDHAGPVAAHIRSLLDEELDFREGKSVVTRKIRPGDIAILLRKFKNVEKYQEALEANRIPYYTVGSRKFFQRPEIAGLIAFVSFLGNPADDRAFLSFFLSPAWGGTLQDAARLKEKYSHFYDCIMRSEDESFVDLRTIITRYSRLARLLKPGEILDSFVGETDYLPKMTLLAMPEQCLANVIKFLQISKELDSLGISLREFSKNIKLYSEEADEGEAALENEKSDSVKIMTVHQAKGLEFPVVIVAEMTENPRKETPSLLFDTASKGFTLYSKELTTDDLDLVYRADLRKQVEEEKRTLYVALTRPREILVMNVDKEAMEKDLKKKRDDTAIGWLPQIVIGLYNDETGQLEKELEDLVTFVKTPAIIEGAEIGREGTAWEEPDKDYMKRFDHLKFRRIVSPTTLDFDDKQTEILEIDIIERTSRSSTAEGLYVHRIFEQLGNPAGRPKGKRLSEILKDSGLLRESAAPERAKEILEQLKELGHHEIIREIEDSEVCRSEVRFERAFDRFILAGVIDKLYKTSDGWKIVDFKLAEKRADMLERYRFQMEFYLYLLKNSLDPVSATILYLKDGDTETVTLQNTRDFEIRLENHVTDQTEEN
ncbi:hypothetical protein Y696_00505 [Mesotoga sp. H07pep.5.4]|uniref:UvrD-helicase domain-containing protein n=1 Tax=Mesotoga sp. H07pep.5.4 TaxID=1463664 RepID=UPI000EF15DFB|nr:UvrD-helicase domain-containing protein [Mesotoga sp. H07pep.5.4]RLL82611.1 hypothetical protein Y696_00505 [Mesotoga sp. H07pep.5.4]